MTLASDSGQTDASPYHCQGDLGGAAWVAWRVKDTTRFNGPIGDLLTRRDGDRAVIRMQPHAGLANVANNLHGGAVMTVIDIALFAGARVLGVQSATSGVTVDLSVQFVGAAETDKPVDTIVQITRETGRLLFLRGTVEQAGSAVASFIGIIRKPTS